MIFLLDGWTNCPPTLFLEVTQMLGVGNNVGDTNYKVAQDVCLNGIHYIFGVDENACDSYCVCNMTDDLFIQYYNFIKGNNYLSMLNEWNSRILKATSELKEQQQDKIVCGEDYVRLISGNTSIIHKVIVINAKALSPEMRFSQNQLQFVVGGLGAEDSSRGNAVMCINVSNSEKGIFKRSDVLGILRADKVPIWAKKEMIQLQKTATESIFASTEMVYHIRK